MHCKMAKKLLNWMCIDVQSWFIDAQRDETDLAGGQNFTRITADIHIILLEIFVVIKISRRTKMSGRSKVVSAKLNFDFFSRTNVRCPALFQGLSFRLYVL